MKLRLIALALALLSALTPVLSFSILPDACIRQISEEEIVLTADPLDGVWVRRDDDPAFDGLTLDVTRRKDGVYTGVIISMSDALAEKGFAVGDRKWSAVTLSEDGAYLLYDLGFRDGRPNLIPKELRIDPNDPDRLTLTVYVPESAADLVSESDIAATAQVYICAQHRFN